MKRKKIFFGYKTRYRNLEKKKKINSEKLAKNRYSFEENLEESVEGLETTFDKIIKEVKILKRHGEFELRKMVRELLEQVDASELKRIIDEEEQKIKGGKNGDL